VGGGGGAAALSFLAGFAPPKLAEVESARNTAAAVVNAHLRSYTLMPPLPNTFLLLKGGFAINRFTGA